MVIRDMLPPGLLGLLLAAFLAAYMSTISSQIVWGSSYIINDFLKPFVLKDKKESQYLLLSRLSTILLLLVSLLITTKIDKISDVWKFMLEYSTGIGVVLIFRWYWWRINAWSEIAAIIAPFLMFPLISYYQIEFPYSLPIILIWSSSVWIAVTFLTKPTDHNILSDFYKKIRPGGIGWKKFAKQFPEVPNDSGFVYLFCMWIFGCIMILTFLFGTGKLIFGDYKQAVFYFIATALSVSLIFICNNKMNKSK